MTYQELLNLINLMEKSELAQKIKVRNLNSGEELQIELLRKSYKPKSIIAEISLDGSQYK